MWQTNKGLRIMRWGTWQEISKSYSWFHSQVLCLNKHIIFFLLVLIYMCLILLGVWGLWVYVCVLIWEFMLVICYFFKLSLFYFFVFVTIICLSLFKDIFFVRFYSLIPFFHPGLILGSGYTIFFVSSLWELLDPFLLLFLW